MKLLRTKKRASTRKRNTVYISLCAFLGLIIGAGYSLWHSGQNQLGSGQPGTIVDGSWKTDFEIGSENASGALRARIARKGLFALKRSEAVYYTRSVDDAGKPLSSSCTYALTGNTLPAEWWSVTLYDETSFLAKNRDGAASINQDQLTETTGNWTAIIGPQKSENFTHWISTNGSSAFDLTLRLYRPDLTYLISEQVSGFPSLRLMSC